MFVEVLRGRVADPIAARAALDRWREGCRPGPLGWVDLTGGVAADGTLIAITRFTSARSTRDCGHRPRHRPWWAAAPELFKTEPRRYDCPTVDALMGGVRLDAEFVQVEAYTGATDVGALRVVDKEFERLAHLRPDLLGVVTAATGDGHAFAANYFSSEAEARASEAREWPPEVMALVRRVAELTDGVEYIDLRDPWMYG